MEFIISDDSQDAAFERDIVPAGTHQMVVRYADEGPNDFKRHDTNPDGQCLKLRLATVQGEYRFVFDDIPRHLTWRAANLAEALGIQPVNGRLSLTPEDCRDKVLTVEISHYTSKAGKTSAVVKRYVKPGEAASAPPKPKPAAIRTRPAAAVTAASNLPDDVIPF